MADTDSSAICPECDGRLRKNGTEIVCEDCGLVSAEEAIDRGPNGGRSRTTIPIRDGPAHP